MNVPRQDQKPPAAVTDLKVTRDGDKVTVTFTAPAADTGAVRYQVKCSDRAIVSYQDFLEKWKLDKDGEVCNW